VNKFIHNAYTILEKLKKWKTSTDLCLHINQNWQLFFTISSSQKYPDPESGSGSGSGSEIPDLQFENSDPDPKLLISDPEHCLELSKPKIVKGSVCQFSGHDPGLDERPKKDIHFEECSGSSVADPKQKFQIRFRIRIQPGARFGSGSGLESAFESRIWIRILMRNWPKLLFLTKKFLRSTSQE